MYAIFIGSGGRRETMRIIVINLLIFGIFGCAKKTDDTALPPTEGTLLFEDNFERATLGSNWLDTGGGYRIVDGSLRVQGAKNKPLWLKKKLPQNARVEFSARSETDAVDIKAEVFGDGKSRAEKASYTATSYVVILGGWNNTRSIIARMNEHGNDRIVREAPKGIPGKTYHFAVIRTENDFRWYLDAELFLQMNDTNPLAGAGHEYFAFNNWASEVYFDDLRIFEL